MTKQIPLLEDQSEASPAPEKKVKLVIYVTPQTRKLLEEFRLVEMGMAKKYRTIGQTLDGIVYHKHNEANASTYWQSVWATLVVKGRKIMERRMERKASKEKDKDI